MSKINPTSLRAVVNADKVYLIYLFQTQQQFTNCVGEKGSNNGLHSIRQDNTRNTHGN